MSDRNKYIQQLIGNLVNAILHKILEKAIETQEIAEKYNKEIKNSFNIAKYYREKINPKEQNLPEKDIEYIKKEITRKINSELLSRVNKGYKNIDFSLIESVIKEYFKELKII